MNEKTLLYQITETSQFMMGFVLVTKQNNVIVNEHGPIKTNGSSNNNTYQSQSNDYNDFNSNNQTNFNQDEFSFCSMCGNKISGNIKYCGKCGYKIK